MRDGGIRRGVVTQQTAKRIEMAVTTVIGLALGLVLGYEVFGPMTKALPISSANDPSTPVPSLAASASETLATRIEVTEVAKATPAPKPTAQAPPSLLPGVAKRGDVDDVLLLYDSEALTNFDVGFCKIAEYYGLGCRRLAVDLEPMTDEALHDEDGAYFKLIGVGAETFLRDDALFDAAELTQLTTAVDTGGSTLFVSKVHDALPVEPLVDLSSGAILDVLAPEDLRRDWLVSAAMPEVTREFSGQVITSTSTGMQNDFGFDLDPTATITPLISSLDNTGQAYPIFVAQKKGKGYLFVDAGQQLEDPGKNSLAEMYYDPYHFCQLLPLMMTMRFVLQDEVWHSDVDYANLIIDDPALVQPWNELSYPDLLKAMDHHNFHTTIAMHPAAWQESEAEVIALFRSRPDRYSLVQHGNNGDGYEFYKYEVSEDEGIGVQTYPARPYYDQWADIEEGLTRMAKHEALTGVPCDRVMVFPYGIAPEPSLVILKEFNFLATINAQSEPLDAAARPLDWTYGMYQAKMEYGNFPMLLRRHPGTYKPFRPATQIFIFDLFIDKPALFYSHTEELFESGYEDFGGVADQINGLWGEVQWRSPGTIMTHLYLRKANDDGSVDVKMYGSHLILENSTDVTTTYHVIKEETLNVPISQLTVNGQVFPYRIEQNQLKLDVSFPAHSSMDVVIHYGH